MKNSIRVAKWLVLVVALGATVLITVGSIRLSRAVEVPAHPAPPADASPERIEEGRRLADVLVCRECHGVDLAGTDFLDGGPFMTLPAPNLTGGRVTPETIERAVRHGVKADGTPLLIMPSEGYAHLTDEDMAAIVAYVASLPDTPRELMSRSVGPIGRAVAAFQAPTLQPARTYPQTSSHRSGGDDAVGRFTPLCAFCHGADFGGQVFTAEAPIWAPNLTSHASGATSWTAEEFAQALREGQTPDGRSLDAAEMPWRGFSSLSDEEVAEIYTFLRGQPAVDRPPPEM